MAGIYIHIPFCKQKCLYCDFYSTAREAHKGPVLERILRELADERNFLINPSVETIYFGGGTPSLYRPAELAMVIECIRSLYNCAAEMEITVEANPDDLSAKYLRGLVEAGFNRISIGIQSFDERDLQFMGRRHTALQAAESVREAQRAGFDNISIDLIYGIPGMSPGVWEANIDTALVLGVQHISAYHLTIEKGTPLWKLARDGRFEAVGESESERQFAVLHQRLTEAGFEHYEISNFALAGRRSRHNSAYWSGIPYLGVGPSAHSFDGHSRRWSVRSVEKYLSAASEDELYETEELTAEDLYNELIMTSLRCSDGINVETIRSRFGSARADEFRQTAEKYITGGVMERVGSVYRILPSGFLVSDGVIADFFVVG